jgi:hypothetical protein
MDSLLLIREYVRIKSNIIEGRLKNIVLEFEITLKI